MIYRRTESGWDEIEMKTYKDNPGSWQMVTRHVFTDGADTRFEVRYFEVGPNGYTSHERHDHEHLVVVIRGKGKVQLGAEWRLIGMQDVVRVPGGVEHQFACVGDEPLGILCVVDRERDRPVLVDATAPTQSSNK